MPTRMQKLLRREKETGCGRRKGSRHPVGELFSAEDMDVEMPHRLAGVGALVGDEAEAAGEPEFVRHCGKLFETTGEGCSLLVAHFDDVGVVGFGQKQEVNGSLGRYVAYDEHILVLIDFCRGNFAFDDLAENAVVHNISFDRARRKLSDPHPVAEHGGRSERDEQTALAFGCVDLDIIGRMPRPKSVFF